MKKVLTIIIFLACVVKAFSQEEVKDHDFYLHKSKSQKTAGYSFLIGGTVAIGLGLLIGNRHESSFGEAGTGVILGGLGFLSMLGSIPFFIASGKNKRKANLMIKSGSIQIKPGTNKRLLDIGVAVSL